MGKGRMEAFSDGVLAIIITIMVLEMKTPPGADFRALLSLGPVFFCYILSYVFIGIYWNNHHHLLHAAQKTNGAILWANLHLLFWISLFPLVTRWMADHRFSPVPVSVYGAVLFMAAIAYYILAHTLIRHHGKGSALALALGKDFKGVISVVIYALAIPLAFWNTWLSLALYILVAIIWVIPDRRIERRLEIL